jgi:hypothetical protein
VRGSKWEYEYEYIGHTSRENYSRLSKREANGWEVLNITGTNAGNDVIWFRRKLKTKAKAPPLQDPCKHGVEEGHMNCITCGPPV